MEVGSLKIITIEGSPLLSKRVQAILEETAGVEFLGNARTIPFALLLIGEQKPDVVILDIQINSDSLIGPGVEILCLLKKQFPEVTLIVLTNQVELHTRITCLANGANYFFDKSIDLLKITNTLKAIQESILTEGQKDNHSPQH